jgi:prepilin signal peptidase PulO-like enzyme (type II secretory pathway)
MIAAALIGAAFFAAAGYLGTLLGSVYAECIQAFEDGPPAHRAPVGLLIGACAILGALVTAHVASPLQILLAGLVCAALVAVFITDARRGIVPDAFTIGPLTFILFAGLLQHDWGVFLSAAAPFVPFAIAAALTRGRGMGWGDVKLAALGGAVLGAQLSLIVFAVACLAAGALNYRRGAQRGPIAFAPYLATAIGLAIPAGVLLQ